MATINTAIKRQIASAAAELIKPGHRIILDSGTTTCEIARQLRQHSDVIAMTNGMNVANALLEAEGVELLMTGGTCVASRSHSMAIRLSSPCETTTLICFSSGWMR